MKRPAAVGSGLKCAARAVVLGVALLALGACKSDEEAAAEHMERAQTYLAEGDDARARVEFMNVLDREPNRLDARLALAALLERTGDRNGALAHLKRAVEQDPENLDALLALSAANLEDWEWDDARTRTEQAARIAPDDPRVKARQAVLAYADAVAKEQPEVRETAHERLRGLRDGSEDLLPLHQAIVDGHVRGGRLEDAIEALDYGLGVYPRDIQLLTTRLQLLYRLDRKDEIVPHFARMLEIYPESQPIREMLVDWHLGQGDLDGAEAALRDLPEDADTEARLPLVNFLAQYRGPEAALKELDKLLAGDTAADEYRLLRAAILFESGQVDVALQEVREVAARATETGEDASVSMFLMAQILDGTGARGEAEEVLRQLLAANPRHVEAGQTLAAWLLERGQAKAAQRVLAAAQAARPEDPQTLSLIGQAHAATGQPELARQMQARAFEASGYAPEIGLRYAKLLSEAGNDGAAIEVVTTALTRAPRHEGLLILLGDYYRVTAQWSLAEGIETRLQELGTVAALLAADRIHFDRLVAEQDLDVAMAYLAGRSAEGAGSAVTYAAIARANLAVGEAERAEAVIELGLEYFPDNRELRAAAAALATTRQDYDRAVEIYTALIDDDPQVERLWLDLLRVHQRREDAEAAGAMLRAALEAIPGSDLLRWELALHYDGQGEADQAIAIYEALLADHPQSAPVRNNLATLLSTARDDAESLERAAELAAPLAGSEVPQFLETYGWIAFRRGDYEAAAPALLTAADALPTDAEAQLHAAEVLVALGRVEEARPRYEAAIALAETADPALATAASEGLAALPAMQREGN
ncbi:tetratricopeptide repeat protein [Vannielia litorea]|uniref:tetratricopeptide repeat protein n=1 Tax=Vannielia litorea TaxID=1217970 RepID=UPI001C979C5B|nr:tetratricopeptide repeat protein [Vannielia litorea]MBY6155158.1 tetratricopeptide repeat protein [Vannielia litorea]